MASRRVQKVELMLDSLLFLEGKKYTSGLLLEGKKSTYWLLLEVKKSTHTNATNVSVAQGLRKRIHVTFFF